MPRSIKKGPFVDLHLQKKVEQAIAAGGGRDPVSPWGMPTKGFKTRSNKTTDKFIVRRRRKRK